jgi:hypothetical protein
MQAPHAEEDAQRAARHADDGNAPLHPALGGAFEEEDFPPLVPSSIAKEPAHQVITFNTARCGRLTRRAQTPQRVLECCFNRDVVAGWRLSFVAKDCHASGAQLSRSGGGVESGARCYVRLGDGRAAWPRPSLLLQPTYLPLNQMCIAEDVGG